MSAIYADVNSSFTNSQKTYSKAKSTNFIPSPKINLNSIAKKTDIAPGHTFKQDVPTVNTSLLEGNLNSSTIALPQIPNNNISSNNRSIPKSSSSTRNGGQSVQLKVLQFSLYDARHVNIDDQSPKSFAGSSRLHSLVSSPSTSGKVSSQKPRSREQSPITNGQKPFEKALRPIHRILVCGQSKNLSPQTPSPTIQP